MFLNLLGAAEGALIRAVASTQTLGDLGAITVRKSSPSKNRRMTMKTFSGLLLLVLISVCVAVTTGSSSGDPEFPQWTEITSATDASDFKLNCEYYALFEYVPGGTRALFMNFVGVGQTGYPGVTSIASADASGGQNFRVENTQKDTVKFGSSSFPARVFQRCSGRLPES